jgi:SAM-dependent methyltransferase
MTLVDERAAKVWRRVPVEGAGYLDSADLLRLPDGDLAALVSSAETMRYQGWRNADNWWIDNLLRMDKRWDHLTGSGERGDLAGAQVLDYGCGLGLEGKKYAEAGARVWLADVCADNVDLADRVLRLHGHPADDYWVIGEDEPPLVKFDVIHCVGVLHHIRDPAPTMELFHELLARDGELRLMVYSDLDWEQVTGATTAASHDLGLRRKFIEAMDHGDVPWSDWYDFDALNELAGEAWFIERTVYLQGAHHYLAAIMRPTQ